MTELETLQRAKMYIDKLANGINPIDDSVIPDGDVVNNVRLSRCFFYVSDVLRQVIDNGGVVKPKKTRKVPFDISFEQIQKYPFSDDSVPLSKIAERINELIDVENMKKISYKNISEWLVGVDMLVVVNIDGRVTKRPTAMGNRIGIATEVRNGSKGEYEVVLYNREAQQFVIDNIDAIIAYIAQPEAMLEKPIPGLSREDKRILEKLGR